MRPVQYDFIEFFPWSKNIDENEYVTHVSDAYKFDVRPQLDQLALDILNYSDNSGTKPELQAFYNDYVRQWWTFLAFRRFIQIHGRNITQFGYTKTADPEGTFTQVDQIERSVVMKQIQGDAQILFALILQKEWKFDGVTYRKPGGDCSRSENRFDIGIGGF